MGDPMRARLPSTWGRRLRRLRSAPKHTTLPRVGLTYVDVELYNPRSEGSVSRSFLVDSGAVYSVAPQAVLRSLGIVPLRSERFTLANGEQTEREIGEVGFSFEGRRATSPVVFGEGEDIYLLGAVTLETLGYVLDPFRRELKPLRMMLA